MRNILFAIFLICSISLFSEPVDSTEAKQIAINFFQYKNPEKAGVKVKFTKTQIYKGEITRYTIVMTDNSFVVVSADNSTVPILAYSDEGAYRENDVPPAFEFWMQTEYDEWVVYNRTHHVDNSKTIQEWNLIKNKNFNHYKSTGSVTPLIKTKWGQTIPNDIPAINIAAYNNNVEATSLCGTGHCAAGCVAVAMAQIMKYWQDIDNDFDWCNMPNELFYYNNPNYIVQRNAIAELIADCGEKADMDYCHEDDQGNPTCSSSSTIGKAKRAFRQDYHYSSDMLHRYRWLTISWKHKMRQSLDNEQPILYGGNKPNGGVGHAFVCDGYDGNDYFHFNWGWRGVDDGYFYIRDNDGSPVIDYYKWQEAVFYLHPEGISIICEDCNSHLTIYQFYKDVPSLYSKFYHPEAGTIYSSPIPIVIANGDVVHYRAYDEIVLENFETEDGAEFTAEIVPCPNTTTLNYNTFINYKSNTLLSNKSDTVINTNNGKIKIYPNPAGDVLYIEGDFDDSDNEVQIYDLLGDMVVSQHIGGNKATIDLSSLPAGVYIVKVFSDDYRFSYQQKIIKQ